MSKIFKITKRHYDIIIKQGYDNLPQEAGGFLGGKDNVIQAIQPIFNQHLFNKTDTFQFTSDDVYRAHQFFKKHKLEYYGMYHTHPNGIAYPSQADIDTGHKYHFIISFRDQENPDFAAFEIKGKQPIHIPLKVIEDKSFNVKDIMNNNVSKSSGPKTQEEEASHLNEIIETIKEDKKPKYPKMPPISGWEDSDFSTLA